MIVAGIGLRPGCSGDELAALVARAAAAAGCRPELLAVPAFRRDAAGPPDAAARLSLPLRIVEAAALGAVQAACPTRSARALAETGHASVAEGCALAAAGPGAVLLLPRIASPNATCAIAGTGSRRYDVPEGQGLCPWTPPKARLWKPLHEMGSKGRGPWRVQGRALALPCRRTVQPMTVHFIGAGPGAADLLTLRGRDLLARCPVCLYAGSIVPREMLAHCPPDARLVDSASLDLDGIEREYVRAEAAGQDVARLHSGDLSLYSALAEQIRRLRRLGIDYTLTPGVPAFAAAAAALERELTVPGIAQSLVLTRVSGRASAMPAAETLAAFGATGATLAIHLAIHALDRIVADLVPLYGADCPVAIVVRASWPDQAILRGTLATIAAIAAPEAIERTALVFVGPALAAAQFRDSALYDPDYRRRFRE